MKSKKDLGAYYTTLSDTVLKEFEEYVKDKDIVDLYAGSGELLEWAKRNGAKSVKGYDINPDCKTDIIIAPTDTLLYPPKIKKDEIVVINPPYLLKNKTKYKEPFEKWKVSDLYKCALKSLIVSGVNEGIVIIPSNFFMDSDNRFRELFFKSYLIDKVICFDKQMFEDTNVRICVIHFIKGETKELFGHKLYKTKIGKDYFKIIERGITKQISRYTSSTKLDEWFVSDIKVYTTDTGGERGIIFVYDTNHYKGKNTDRNVATIIFHKSSIDEGKLSKEEQLQIIGGCNSLLNHLRRKYDSMFLTNFLAGKDGVMRKRLAFNEAYALINYVKEVK